MHSGAGGQVFCVYWGVVRAVQALERAWSGVLRVHAMCAWQMCGGLCVCVCVCVGRCEEG